MTRMKESKALLEVREWKAAAWREVAHLPLDEAIMKRLADSAKTAERLGFHIPKREEKPMTVVAETPAKYAVKRGKRKQKSGVRSRKL